MDLGSTGAIEGLATGHGSEGANGFATTACLEHESLERSASDFTYKIQQTYIF